MMMMMKMQTKGIVLIAYSVDNLLWWTISDQTKLEKMKICRKNIN
jgi:hypothetical protein